MFARTQRRLLAAGVLLSGLSVPPAAHAFGPGAQAHVVAVASASLLGPLAEPRRALVADLDALRSEPVFAAASWGIAAIDLTDDHVLWSHEPDAPRNPASNIKLVTSAAALALLGPEHRFATEIYFDPNQVKGDELQGDLYLRGSGDPTLVTADLYELAGRLRARGLRKVKGRIIVDEQTFGVSIWPPGFEQKEEWASYRPKIGAASVNFNTIVLRVAATGATARIVLDPPVRGILDVQGAPSIVDGRRNRMTVEAVPADDGRLQVTLGGELGRDAGERAIRLPVLDPAKYLGAVATTVLAQRGVRVRKAPRVGSIPSKLQRLAVHVGDPLSVQIRSVNKLSNNYVAEQILRALAPDDHPGDIEAALNRVREWFTTLGIPGEPPALGNGSGLYDTNRIAAAQVAALLARMYRDFRYSSDYLASLAVMGADGTTRRRLRDAEGARWIRAKTGTLDGVSALSGYASAEGRQPVAFSILVNDFKPGRLGEVRALQDRIAERLASYAVKARPRRDGANP